MLKKLRENLYTICNYLELFMALVVIVGIVIAAFGLKNEILLFWAQKGHAGAFYVFLDAVFEIVISIEFLKMLCQPSADTVLEVLIFLVSRHMIIGETSPFEDLISIVSIALLFGIKKHISIPAKKGMTHSFFENREESEEEES